MKRTIIGALLCLAQLLPESSFSQTNTYILNGSAIQNNCNCYTLTKPDFGQSGSVWNSTKIDLRQSFDMVFSVNLGCKDVDGADGIVFILQPISTSIGGDGGGMGFSGVSPSIGFALDTWQNTDYNDPAYDHISIQANGNLDHQFDLSGPFQASAISGNIEDCQWHTLRITWESSSQWLRGYFDNILRVETQTDLISTIFNNDPMVYWGFGAATGGSTNLQQFCTALIPDFNTGFTNNSTCIGNSTITFNNTSSSFAPLTAAFWDFGDGSTSTDFQPAPHTYQQPGLYPVKMAITGMDGCKSDTLVKTIIIGDRPVADFQVFDTCAGKPPRLTDLSSTSVGTVAEWKWKLNGQEFSSLQDPDLASLPAGNYLISLEVLSTYGCRSDESNIKSFTLKPNPEIEAEIKDGCVFVPLEFKGIQLDNSTSITQWNWNMGDRRTVSAAQHQTTFSREGKYLISVMASAGNGCISETITKEITISAANANAGRDTTVIQNTPYQLTGSGGMKYEWTPSLGLSDPFIANPIAILKDDQRYFLKVTSEAGCEDQASIYLTVFKGSSVQLPSAFTPNQDGLNDLFQPGMTGIRHLDYFSVYNRWGQLIYSTKDPMGGWNGKFSGVDQAAGVYVWKLRAIDFIGKTFEQKGTVLLIR